MSPLKRPSKLSRFGRYAYETADALISRFSRHLVGTHAAALAYYTVFALAPLLILLVAFLGSLNLDLQAQLQNEVQNLVGPQAARLFEAVLAKARQDSRAGLWGWLALLLSSSVIFAQLQTSLDVIFEAPAAAARGFWKGAGAFLLRRLICFAMVFAFVALTVLSLILTFYIAALMPKGSETFATWIHKIGAFVVYALLFGAIFRWTPNRKVSGRAAFRGGLWTSGLFLIGQAAIGFYLKHASIGSAYGAAGSMLVLLVWVYYSSVIVFYGAEIAARKNRLKKA